jgi:hypothetical protein
MNRQNHSNFDRHTSSFSPGQNLITRAWLAMILGCALVMIVASGCATKKIETERIVEEDLPRPNQILVYDFAATPAEVPADSFITREFSVDTTAMQTTEEAAAGRDLGSRIAEGVAAHLREKGLPAKRVPLGTTLPTGINDIVLRGYLVSVKEGSAAKRIIIGFGAGASELKAAMEGFQVTEQGLRKLGSGTGQFKGSKGPGAGTGAVGYAATGNPAGLIVSSGMKLYGETRGSSKIQARAQTAAKEIAKVLEKRARELGWIG